MDIIMIHRADLETAIRDAAIRALAADMEAGKC